MPISGDAAFREGNNLYLLARRIDDKALDRREVRLLITWSVLELNGSDADIAHVLLTHRHQRTKELIERNVVFRRLGVVVAATVDGEELLVAARHGVEKLAAKG